MPNTPQEWKEKLKQELENYLIEHKDNQTGWYHQVKDFIENKLQNNVDYLNDFRGIRAAVQTLKENCVSPVRDYSKAVDCLIYLFEEVGLKNKPSLQTKLNEYLNALPRDECISTPEPIDISQDLLSSQENKSCLNDQLKSEIEHQPISILSTEINPSQPNIKDSIIPNEKKTTNNTPKYTKLNLAKIPGLRPIGFCTPFSVDLFIKELAKATYSPGFEIYVDPKHKLTTNKDVALNNQPLTKLGKN